MNKRLFTLAAVVTFVTNVIVSHREELQDFMRFMIGSYGKINGEDLLRETLRLRKHVIEKYPTLAEITPPKNLSSEQQCKKFINDLIDQGYPPFYEFSPIG